MGEPSKSVLLSFNLCRLASEVAAQYKDAIQIPAKLLRLKTQDSHSGTNNGSVDRLSATDVYSKKH